MWLLPIIDAIQEGPSNRYQHLHTIDVDLQWTCGWDVIYLLKLPALEKLFLRSMSCAVEVIDVDELGLPLEASSSKIHTLVLHDLDVLGEYIEHMAASCQASSHFECGRKSFNPTRRNHEPWAQVGSSWLA